MTSPFAPRRRIVTPAWVKNAPTSPPAAVAELPPRRRTRHASTPQPVALRQLPGGGGRFITHPDVLLAMLGEAPGVVVPHAEPVSEVTEGYGARGELAAAVDDDARENENKELDEVPVLSAWEVAILCREHLAFADVLARELHASLGEPVPVDLLVSAAPQGLWLAARRFDAARGVPFRTFAKRRVAGAVIDELRAERVLAPRRRQGSPRVPVPSLGTHIASGPMNSGFAMTQT